MFATVFAPHGRLGDAPHLNLSRSPARDRLPPEPGLAELQPGAPPQVGLSRHQRPDKIGGAFTVVEPGEVAGRELFQLDDVFTRAITVSECARILRRARASTVSLATGALALNHDAAHLKPGREVDVRLTMADAG